MPLACQRQIRAAAGDGRRVHCQHGSRRVGPAVVLSVLSPALLAAPALPLLHSGVLEPSDRLARVAAHAAQLMYHPGCCGALLRLQCHRLCALAPGSWRSRASVVSAQTQLHRRLEGSLHLRPARPVRDRRLALLGEGNTRGTHRGFAGGGRGHGCVGTAWQHEWPGTRQKVTPGEVNELTGKSKVTNDAERYREKKSEKKMHACSDFGVFLDCATAPRAAAATATLPVVSQYGSRTIGSTRAGRLGPACNVVNEMNLTRYVIQRNQVSSLL